MKLTFHNWLVILFILLLSFSLNGCFLTMYTPIETLAPTETEPKVEVYYLSKFSCETAAFEGSEETTEQDIIDLIDWLIRGYSYAGDCITFRIFVEGEIDLSIYEDLNCEDLYIFSDPEFVVARVRFEDIDTDALFALGRREEIRSIRILPPWLAVQHLNKIGIL